MAAITMDGVSKRFRDVVAVDNLSFEVEEGEIFGFLGPNGAGKTTTIDLMLDFVRPTAGQITVLGHDVTTDPVAVRRQCGVLPEGVDVWDRLTGRQHLEFAIDSKAADAAPEAMLERVGIPEAIDRRAGDYSTGMTQRLMLAMALVGEPDLLILDEPSAGLDPNGAREMREIVREENDRGATVFFSSHLLGQVEAVCDRVGILQEGKMVAVDTIEGLRESIGSQSILRVQVDRVDPAGVAAVEAVDGVSRVDVQETEQRLVVYSEGSNTAILEALEGQDIAVIDFRTEEASLEDVFRAYTTSEEIPA